jgi:hypothetical protein
VQWHPDAPALDDGTRCLTVRPEAGTGRSRRRGSRASRRRGVGGGDRWVCGCRRAASSLYLAVAWRYSRHGAVPTVPRCDVDDPPRARRPWSSARPGVCVGARRRGSRPAAAVGGGSGSAVRGSTTTRGSSSALRAAPGRPRASAVSHRSAAAFVDAEAGCSCRRRRSGRATACWPGCPWPSTRRARRCAGLAVRRLPGARARAPWCAAGWTSGRGWSLRTSPWSRPCRPWRPVAGRVPGGRAAAGVRRRGLSARAGGAARRRRP